METTTSTEDANSSSLVDSLSLDESLPKSDLSPKPDTESTAETSLAVVNSKNVAISSSDGSSNCNNASDTVNDTSSTYPRTITKYCNGDAFNCNEASNNNTDVPNNNIDVSRDNVDVCNNCKDTTDNYNDGTNCKDTIDSTKFIISDEMQYDEIPNTIKEATVIDIQNPEVGKDVTKVGRTLPDGNSEKKLVRRIRRHPVQVSPVSVEIQRQPSSKKLVTVVSETGEASCGSGCTTPVDGRCAAGGGASNAGLGDVEPKTIKVPLVEEDNDEESQRCWCFNYTREQQMTLISLCLVDFTSFLGMSIMAPFFPMEAGEKGMNEATVGFVFSTYALVMFIASPIIGYLLPHIGSKFIFLSGLFLSGGCTVLFGILDEVSDSTFDYMCFLIRSFEALGAAAYSTASCTMVADMFSDNIGAVFGLLETFVGLGSAIGPAIGGALYAVGGFKLPFILLGFFMILMVPVNIYLLPETTTSSAKLKPGSTIHLLKLPAVSILGLVIIVQGSAWAFLDPFLEPHLSVFELNTETVGLIFLMLAATYGIFCPIWGWVSDKWNRTSCMMVTGMIITAFSLLLIGPSEVLPFLDNELWLNIVSLIIMGVAMALAIIPTFQSMMDNALESGLEDDIGTYSLVSGVWSAAYSLGDFIGPSLGGIMVTSFGFPTAASGIALIILLAAVILITYELFLKCKRKTKALYVSSTIKHLPQDLTEKVPLLNPALLKPS